jgi:hypothetical protein
VRGVSRIALAPPLALLLVACGGGTREAHAPPPITASAPTPSPAATPTAAGTSTTPLTERAAEERVVAKPLSVTPISTPVPQNTPDPSVPPPATIPDPASIKPGPTADPLRVMQDSQARKYDYERRLQRLSGELDVARAEVVRREKDLLAFKNPFLPRPQLPPEEAQAIQEMDGAARVKWAEERLTAAKVALETAQKSYDDAKANPPLN